MVGTSTALWDNIVYDVWTTASRDEIDEVALEIFREWILFAEGKETIGGKFLMHPTGKYASALRLDISPNHVAIIADASIAPEALFLEKGHGPIDLKETVKGIRHIHMHRGGGIVERAEFQPQPSIPRPGPRGLTYKTPSLYAKRRAQYGMREGSEFATLSPDSAPGSWVIPAMPAYLTAKTLADKAREMLAGRAV